MKNLFTIFLIFFTATIYAQVPTIKVQGSGGGSGSGWLLTGNAATDPATNFVGTTDAQPLVFKTNGALSGQIDFGNSANLSLGYLSFLANAGGTNNVAIGGNALRRNTTGISNISIGAYSMWQNTTGSYNMSMGGLGTNVVGSQNAAIGINALGFSLGSNNIANGFEAGQNDATGGPLSNSERNIFIGSQTKALADGDFNEMVIGDTTTGHGSNTITLGNRANDSTFLGGYGHGAIEEASTYILGVDARGKIVEVSGVGSGTVTNIATGLGLSGGPITTTGTLLVDTSSASILSRQRAAATYAPISINGTVTNVAALTLTTSGTDLTSSVANSTTTPVITLNVPSASASNRGVLTSADWSTFNGKQAAISVTSPITLTGASVGMVNQGTTTTVLHGNASGNPSFGSIVNADITNGTIDLSTKVTGLLAIANGGTGAATTSQSFSFIGPTSGSGAPSFRALVAGDIPSLSGTYLPLVGAAYTTTTGNGLDITSSTLTTGTLAALTITGTAATSNTKKAFSITSSGANGTASQTVTGQTISVTNTGTTNTNVGLNVTASGATNNYAALFTGSVGIGTAAPASLLHVYNAISAKAIIEGQGNSTNGFSSLTFKTDNGTGAEIFAYGSGAVSLGGASSLNIINYIAAPITFWTSNLERVRILGNGNIGIGQTTATALLHIKAGTATASTAPLKFTSGTNLTVAEAGAIEYDATELYETNSTAVRGTVVVMRGQTSSAGTLTLAYTYTDYVFSGTTSTWTAPAVAANYFHTFYLKNAGSGDVTLNSSAGGNDFYTTALTNTVTIAAGSAVILRLVGSVFYVE